MRCSSKQPLIRAAASHTQSHDRAAELPSAYSHATAQRNNITPGS